MLLVYNYYSSTVTDWPSNYIISATSVLHNLKNNFGLALEEGIGEGGEVEWEGGGREYLCRKKGMEGPL